MSYHDLVFGRFRLMVLISNNRQVYRASPYHELFNHNLLPHHCCLLSTAIIIFICLTAMRLAFPVFQP